MARIEFYVGDDPGYIEVIREDGAVPRKGEFIDIRRVVYRVEGVTWAIDTNELKPTLRANVVLKPRKIK